MKRICLVSMCLVLFGFGPAPQPPLKVYSGPERPLTEVASIRGSNLCEANGKVIGETRIEQIDGAKAQSFARGFQRDLLVAPGRISVQVWWFYANIRTEAPVQLTIEAQAGHRYIIRAQSDYKERANFHVEDLGPGSGAVEFRHPVNAKGKPSNCY